MENPDRRKEHVWAGLLFGAFALAARASDGRVPVYQVTTITQPGTYYLTQDINAGGSTAVTIQSNNVTLDLNGHTITGTGYMITGINYTNIRVTNGTLSGGTFGCYLSCANGRFTVDHLNVLNSSSYGIFLLGDPASRAVVTVEDDVVVGTATGQGIAIVSAGGGRVSHCIVRGSTGSWPSGLGLRLDSSTGVAVEENTFSANSAVGIMLYTSSNCEVSRNTVTGTIAGNGYGIWLTNSSSANAVDWNTISGGGYVGLAMDSGCNNNEYSYNRSRANLGGSYSIGGTNDTDGGGNF